MILSKDKTVKNKVTKGTRTLANEKFASFISQGATKTAIFNATVLIRYNNLIGKGTGVILNDDADADGGTCYVLTAKHLLTSFTEQDPTVMTPAEMATEDFLGKLKIFYGPTAVEGAPPATSAADVSAVNFTGSDGETWDYDIMVLESKTEAFRTFVKNNRFLIKSPSEFKPYKDLLTANGRGCPILDSSKFTFLQTGYGDGRDPDVAATSGYDDKAGLFQCRWPEVAAREPLASAFEINTGKGDKGQPVYSVGSSLSNLVAVRADATTSTGPGDSGGPLFAVQTSDTRNFYLIGVTAGANYFTDPAYRQDPSKAPRDTVIANNVTTYWDQVFLAWNWNT